MRHAAGELDHLEAALNVALGIGDGLAVLGGEHRRERIHLLGDQFEKLEHHPRAALRIGRGPGRLRGLRVRDRGLDFLLARERDPGLHFAGIGIEHVAEPAGCACDHLAADEMADLTHTRLPLNSLAFIARHRGLEGRPRPDAGPSALQIAQRGSMRKAPVTGR